MGYRLFAFSGLVAAAAYFYLQEGEEFKWDFDMAQAQGNLTAFVLGGTGAGG